MASRLLPPILNRLSHTLRPAAEEDGRLLEAFRRYRDEAAFAALVGRHGPMVLGVCRRVTGNVHDAEDAFQAAFLVLARRPEAVRPGAGVGPWLYGVAYRTALKARSLAARRRARERPTAALPDVAAPPPAAAEGRAVIDAELSRLPERYRTLLVLCDLEGRPQRAVAQQLGLGVGTLTRWLARARAVLADRLRRRGLALGVGLAALAAPVPVSAALSRTTTQTGLLLAAGGAGLATPAALRLAKGVTVPMNQNRTLLAVLALGLVLAVGFLGGPAPTSAARPPAPAAEPPPAQPAPGGRLLLHRGQDLYQVKPDGQDGTVLGPIPTVERNYQDRSARLSRDGKRLAFGYAAERDGGAYPPNKIYVRELTGTAAPVAVVAMPEHEFHHWAWSPDGTRIAFISWKDGEGYRSWYVDVITQKATEIPMPTAKGPDGQEYRATVQAWSADGKSVIAAGDGLVRVGLDGTVVARLTREPVRLLAGSVEEAPDGRHLLFIQHGRTGQEAGLAVLEIASGKVQTLIQAQDVWELRGCWSPDGRRLAYTMTIGRREEAESTLTVCDPDGGRSATPLTSRQDPACRGMIVTAWR